jgi:predicted helicase
LVIDTTGVGASRPFSALITDTIPNLDLLEKGQCFPLYEYELAEGEVLFAGSLDSTAYVRRDAISDRSLTTYRTRYGGDVTKEDIFYYIYGILHAPEYQMRYASDLKKMIPRIPMVDDFAVFAKAGRDLASWHLAYETVEPWPLTGLPTDPHIAADARVTKMRFGRTGSKDDRTTIVYNSTVVLSDIPADAYEYEVNGRSAIEWIMDRYQMKADKDSGIVNDPNTWSDDPRYIVDLVARIVRVSMETVQIVRALPRLRGI